MKHYAIETLKNGISFWQMHVKQDLIAELEALRAIAEAAENVRESKNCRNPNLCSSCLGCIEDYFVMYEALKAWRGK